MTIREQIEIKIRKKFNPLYLDVMNESDSHNVPINSESHFKIVVVSHWFNGEGILSRHRAIYSVLAEELAGAVHALALHTYTLKEWEGLQVIISTSPTCCGAELTN